MSSVDDESFIEYPALLLRQTSLNNSSFEAESVEAEIFTHEEVAEFCFRHQKAENVIARLPSRLLADSEDEESSHSWPQNLKNSESIVAQFKSGMEASHRILEGARKFSVSFVPGERSPTVDRGELLVLAGGGRKLFTPKLSSPLTTLKSLSCPLEKILYVAAVACQERAAVNWCLHFLRHFCSSELMLSKVRAESSVPLISFFCVAAEFSPSWFVSNNPSVLQKVACSMLTMLLESKTRKNGSAEESRSVCSQLEVLRTVLEALLMVNWKNIGDMWDMNEIVTFCLFCSKLSIEHRIMNADAVHRSLGHLLQLVMSGLPNGLWPGFVQMFSEKVVSMVEDPRNLIPVFRSLASGSGLCGARKCQLLYVAFSCICNKLFHGYLPRDFRLKSLISDFADLWLMIREIFTLPVGEARSPVLEQRVHVAVLCLNSMMCATVLNNVVFDDLSKLYALLQSFYDSLYHSPRLNHALLVNEVKGILMKFTALVPQFRVAVYKTTAWDSSFEKSPVNVLLAASPRLALQYGSLDKAVTEKAARNLFGGQDADQSEELDDLEEYDAESVDECEPVVLFSKFEKMET